MSTKRLLLAFTIGAIASIPLIAWIGFWGALAALFVVGFVLGATE